jgi:hypothetical protein
MLAEGHMLEAGGSARDIALARQQVVKASGATGPGVMGIMHWQAAQIAGPWRAWNRENDLGPMGCAAAAAAWALTVILETCSVTSLDDERFMKLSDMIVETGQYLPAAQEHLQEIHDSTASLGEDLFPLFGD